MRVVVHRIDAPRVAGVLVLDVADAVDRRVAQVDVARAHVDLDAQGARAVGELAGAHAPEQVEVFFDAALAERRIAAGFRERAAIRAYLLGGQVADEGLAVGDQFFRALVEDVEIVGGMAQLVPFETQPAHVLLDRLDVLDVFLGRVGIVEAQIAAAAELARDTEIQADRLGMADMQIAVGLRWEAGRDAARVLAGGLVVDDDLADEVIVQRGFVGHGVAAACRQCLG